MGRKLGCAMLTLLLVARWCYADAPAAKWSPVFKFGDKELFPSLIISVANLRIPAPKQPETLIGDPFGMIGIQIVSPRDNTKVKVSIQADSIIESGVYECTLPTAGRTYGIVPHISYRYDALARVRQTIPLSISYHLDIDGDSAGDKVQTITLHSINDCPYAAKVGKTIENLSFVFGSYVNEDHPLVQQILKEALAARVVKNFIGYQGTKEDVLAQMSAVWYALQARGVKYSSITDTSAPSDSVFLQHVRFVDETMQYAQANCVDGSVVFASVLEKIGLHTSLAKVPGHCFLVVQLEDKKDGAVVALETTLIGNLDLRTQLFKKTKSKESFNQAVAYGTQELNDHAKKKDLQLINIGLARKAGIRAIPYEPDLLQSAAH